MPLGLNLRICSDFGLGGISGVSSDVTLTSWTIDGTEVVGGPATIDLANTYDGTALSELTVVITPQNGGATVGTVSLVPDPLSVSADSVMSFVITAEDGVTTEDYEVTLHVLASRYRRPDGTSSYLRPDGVSYYLRP